MEVQMITVITKTAYKTSDGRLFSDKTLAELHEERTANKKVHYILDFANGTVTKVNYLTHQHSVTSLINPPNR